MTGRIGRRRKQVLYDKETKGFWKMKEEAVDCILWRSGFGRAFGLARHCATSEWIYEACPESIQPF